MWRSVTLGARGIGDKWLHRHGHKMSHTKLSITDVYLDLREGYYVVKLLIFDDLFATKAQG